MSNNIDEKVYELQRSLANKFINEDGIVTDLAGNVIDLENADDVWLNKSSLPNKWLNPDGSISTLNEIITSIVDTSIYVIVVDELPEEGNPNKIYLLPNDGKIDEYHWTGTAWDPIGMLEFDISDYSTTEEMNLAISTALSGYVPMQSFPASFDTTHSTLDFFDSIKSANPAVGSYFLGLVTLTDMPIGLIQAEVQVSVYPNKVLYATMRSADLSPYMWEANSFDFEGWKEPGADTLQDAKNYTDQQIGNALGDNY